MRGRSARRTGTGDFADPAAAAGLREFMDGRAWTHAEGPARLFEQAAGWLRRNRVLLPGVSVLARLTSSVREAAAERMPRTLAEAAAGAGAELPARLGLLLGGAGGAAVLGVGAAAAAADADVGAGDGAGAGPAGHAAGRRLAGHRPGPGL